MNTKLCEDIDWVGFVDWNVRDFHGYETMRGSSYNAYLIRDEKTALIDTVKAPYGDVLLGHIRALTECEAVDYIVVNHAEPDHAGAMTQVVRACPNAVVVCNAKCRAGLAGYHDISTWKFRIVSDGESLSLGKRSLVFIDTPMAHWPESMATYVPEERLLFSMDAFGQHYASSSRFDDQEPWDVIYHEAKTYYANILMLYGKPGKRVLEKVGKIDVEVIAPSHGVIYRKHVQDIIAHYQRWTSFKPEPKVLVMYDTMWGSTALMAQAILAGAQECRVEAKLFYIRATHITLLATEMLDAACLAFGSSTLNMTLMPQAAATLTYLKGLRPGNKAGFAFGSYGWGKGGPEEVDEYLRKMKFDMLREPLKARYRPTDEVLEACRAAGREMAEKALAMAARG